MIYLASPYSHPDPFVREERYIRTMKVLTDLLAQKVWAFSPIVHCHELKKITELPATHTFWLEYDFHILERCDKLYILRLEGWEQSLGVAAEKKFAEDKGIPVEYI